MMRYLLTALYGQVAFRTCIERLGSALGSAPHGGIADTVLEKVLNLRRMCGTDDNSLLGA